MPNMGSKYNEIVEWMHSNWNGRSDRMKRIVVEAQEVSEILEETPLSSFLVDQ